MTGTRENFGKYSHSNDSDIVPRVITVSETTRNNKTHNIGFLPM